MMPHPDQSQDTQEASQNQMEMETCPQCNHRIPRLNMIIHQATACSRNRSRDAQGRMNTNTNDTNNSVKRTARQTSPRMTTNSNTDTNTNISSSSNANMNVNAYSNASVHGNAYAMTNSSSAQTTNSRSPFVPPNSDPSANVSHDDRPASGSGSVVSASSSPPRSRPRMTAADTTAMAAARRPQVISRRADSGMTHGEGSGSFYQHYDDDHDDDDYDEDYVNYVDQGMDAIEIDQTPPRNRYSDTSNSRREEEVINLDDDEDAEKNHDNNDDDSVIDAQWVCPRCTLLNPINDHSCNACNYSNVAQGSTDPQRSSDPRMNMPSMYSNINANQSDGVRSPDLVRRERLIGSNFGGSDIMRQRQLHMMMEFERQMAAAASASANEMPYDDANDNNMNDPNGSMMRSVGSSALLGSAIGAISGISRNRGVLGSAMEGAFAGAVGGAISHRISSTPPHPGTRTDSLRRTNSRRRSNRSANVNVNVSTNGSVNVNGRNAMPTSRTFQSMGHTYRVHSGPGFRVMTMNMPMSMSGSAPVDGMDYESLLEAFGDGTENRGTDMGVIRSLPSVTLTNVERELPEDHRECSICLERFQNGEKRKTLPCLHGFHEKCIDKWLKGSRTCPVCKFDVQGSS